MTFFSCRLLTTPIFLRRLFVYPVFFLNSPTKNKFYVGCHPLEGVIRGGRPVPPSDATANDSRNRTRHTKHTPHSATLNTQFDSLNNTAYCVPRLSQYWPHNKTISRSARMGLWFPFPPIPVQQFPFPFASPNCVMPVSIHTKFPRGKFYWLIDWESILLGMSLRVQPLQLHRRTSAHPRLV